MTAGIDQPRTIGPEPDQPAAALAAELPALTVEEARRLAAILAPHLVAMRAVTAGTRYEYTVHGANREHTAHGAADGAGTADGADREHTAHGADGEYTAHGADGADALVSPAVKIFIAGMLQRLPA
jgi:hypothetical protein